MSTTRLIPVAVNLDAIRADQALAPANAAGEPDRIVGGLQIVLVQRDTVVWRLFFRRASANHRLSPGTQIAVGARTQDFATALFAAVAQAGDVEVNLGTEQAPIWAYEIESDLNTTEVNDALASTASIEAVADIELSAAGSTPTSFRFRPTILKEAYTGEPPTPQPGQSWLDLATGDARYLKKTGHRYVVVNDAGSDTDRGAALLAAYAAATTPSDGTRFVILLPPGVYDLGTSALQLTKSKVDIVALVPAKCSGAGTTDMVLEPTVKITSAGDKTVTQTANDVHVVGLELANTKANVVPEYNSNDPATYWPDSGVTDTIFERVKILGGYNGQNKAWPIRLGITYTQTWNACLVIGYGTVSGRIESGRPSTHDRMRVALFGDSYLAANGGGYENPTIFGIAKWAESKGAWNWATGFLRKPATLVANAAVGGQVTSQMVARLSDVLSTDSDIVIICAGANDVVQGVSLSTITTNLDIIVSRIVASGKKVMILTVPPTTSTSQHTLRSRVNDYISLLPYRYSHVAVADTHGRLASPDTGLVMAGYTRDGVHWSEVGCDRVGRLIADAVSTLTPRGSWTWIPVSSAAQVLSNPAFANNGSGWTVLGNGNTFSTTPSEEHHGNIGVIQTTGESSPLIQTLEYSTGGKFAPGDVIYGIADIEWERNSAASTTVWRPYLRVIARNTDGSFDAQLQALRIGTADEVPIVNSTPAGRMIVRTPVAVLGQNVNRIYCDVGFQSRFAGTVKIHRVGVIRS